MQNLTHSQSPKEALTDYPLWVIWLVRILALGALGVAICPAPQTDGLFSRPHHPGH